MEIYSLVGQFSIFSFSGDYKLVNIVCFNESMLECNFEIKKRATYAAPSGQETVLSWISNKNMPGKIHVRLGTQLGVWCVMRRFC